MAEPEIEWGDTWRRYKVVWLECRNGGDAKRGVGSEKTNYERTESINPNGIDASECILDVGHGGGP